ncbi:MAG: glycosyltransferase family 2 protein [Proteobacteria bacterium]|nr:glycosyltransferase family 2 protein [Pseudomonadota bacterium]
MRTRYVIITPTRDEERTVEQTLRSVTSQTVRPVRWVIVNDGSTDRTREIIERYLPEHPWIELVDRVDRGYRALGGGVVDAFDCGFERVRDLGWDFVVKLDADLAFEPDYFERLLQRFDDNPKLGMASGKTFLVEGGQKRIEYCHDEHVRGPAKMYARDCFERIGGLEPVRGWDMIDETRAQMLGLETRSFLDLEIIHLRPIDGRQSQVLRSRFEMGKLYYFLGYHWLYHLVRSARSAWQDYPRGIGGIMLLLGYFTAALRGAEQYDPEYVAFVHRKQRERLSLAHWKSFWRSSVRPTT